MKSMRPMNKALMTELKIAQVCHHYLPHLGGIEFYIKRLVDHLATAGISSQVLTTDFKTPENGRRAGVMYFKTSLAFMRNPFSLDLIRHLRKNRYDVLHLHSVWFLPCLLAAVFGKNARIIVTMHGVYPDKADWKLKLVLNLYKPFAGFVLKKSDVVIVLSENEKEKLKRIFKVPSAKIAVINNGINIEPYAEQKKEQVILFTGRVIADKNPDVLIKAVARLDERWKDFKLVFVGPASNGYKKTLIRLSQSLGVPNEIQFVDQLDQSIPGDKKEFMGWYQRAAVFVSLGSWEGLPTRLMEAMQFKTPVIAFASGGTTALVTDGTNGFVIGTPDAAQLADRLERILSDETMARELGEAARTTIERGFDWSEKFKEILRTYSLPNQKPV
jgi:glycosyltransferase involved in cell wall biosynthesis